MRLDKFLADMSIGSRSQVKQYIRNNRVTVNGSVIRDPGYKVTAETDHISLDQAAVSYVKHSYYMFHKPAGCVTAHTDPLHQTVMDYFRAVPAKNLFPVGRLDLDTEGLLLITNDGALAHELLAPAKKIKKTYYARLAGQATTAHVQAFRAGIDIGERRPLAKAWLQILASGSESEVLLTIQEGKFHQVKRMFAVFGLKVIYLKRLTMGGLKLDEGLAPGEYRELTDVEKQAVMDTKANPDTIPS